MDEHVFGESKRFREDQTKKGRQFIPWSESNEDVCWYNYPLDCLLMKQEIDGILPQVSNSENSKLVVFCENGNRSSDEINGHGYLGGELISGRAIEVGFYYRSIARQLDEGGIFIFKDDSSWLKGLLTRSNEGLELVIYEMKNSKVTPIRRQFPSQFQQMGDHLAFRASRINEKVTLAVGMLHDNSLTSWMPLYEASFEINDTLYIGPYSCATGRDGLYVEFVHFVEEVDAN